MIRHIGIHRADHAQIIGKRGQFGKQLAHFQAALAVLRELERRFEARAGRALGFEHIRQRFAVVFVQHRLRVEGIDLRRAAIHEEMHHAFRLRLKMRPSHGQRVQSGRGGLRAGKQRSERETAHAHADAVQQLATSQEGMLQARSMMGRGLGHRGVLLLRCAARVLSPILAAFASWIHRGALPESGS